MWMSQIYQKRNNIVFAMWISHGSPLVVLPSSLVSMEFHQAIAQQIAALAGIKEESFTLCRGSQKSSKGWLGCGSGKD